jgi:poly-gamma-glutamate synthesis protein (capsule biosynthesis protein)
MKRRQFISQLLAAMVSPMAWSAQQQAVTKLQQQSTSGIRLFLCGDVMTGRGIDQILPYANDPAIYEPYIKNAKDYVFLAEKKNGLINKPVAFEYIWGDALAVFQKYRPDVKIINLETSITKHPVFWPGKGIQYRMHPDNIMSLTAAGIDICTLGNNHVLDWHYEGLRETLQSLIQAKIQTSGAGYDLSDARQPAIKSVPGKGRVLVFSYAHVNSGTPYSWAAGEQKPGVNLLPDYSAAAAAKIAEQVAAYKNKGDIAIASIHWGSNWGYELEPGQQQFAQELIDSAGIDLIHGHSSHHPRGIEVYKNKAILYGCGDFLNDYEGISGHEAYRGELGFMYFIDMDARTGNLLKLELVPTRIKNLRVTLAEVQDGRWLQTVLNREGRKFGTRTTFDDKGILHLSW